MFPLASLDGCAGVVMSTVVPRRAVTAELAASPSVSTRMVALGPAAGSGK